VSLAASDLRRVPLTAALCGACIVLTLFFWGGRDVAFLLEDPLHAKTEPWRFVTSMFFHGDVLHLLFNLYWVWLLGSALEPWLGRWRLLGLVVVSAFASSAWEAAIFHGGIGASGVVYALYGFAWVLRDRPPARGVVNRDTTVLLVGWFFLCIVTTVIGVWNVANVAHGVGALTGLLVGAAARFGGARRAAAVIGIIATAATGYLAASLRRPFVDLAALGGHDGAVFDVSLGSEPRAGCRPEPWR
jgi:GlpG protein